MSQPISLDIPEFSEIQRDSFLKILKVGLIEALEKINPISPERLPNHKLFFYSDKYVLVLPEKTLRDTFLEGNTYGCKIYVPTILCKDTKDSYLESLRQKEQKIMYKSPCIYTFNKSVLDKKRNSLADFNKEKVVSNYIETVIPNRNIKNFLINNPDYSNYPLNLDLNFDNSNYNLLKCNLLKNNLIKFFFSDKYVNYLKKETSRSRNNLNKKKGKVFFNYLYKFSRSWLFDHFLKKQSFFQLQKNRLKEKKIDFTNKISLFEKKTLSSNNEVLEESNLHFYHENISKNIDTKKTTQGKKKKNYTISIVDQENNDLYLWKKKILKISSETSLKDSVISNKKTLIKKTGFQKKQRNKKIIGMESIRYTEKRNKINSKKIIKYFIPFQEWLKEENKSHLRLFLINNALKYIIFPTKPLPRIGKQENMPIFSSLEEKKLKKTSFKNIAKLQKSISWEFTSKIVSKIEWVYMGLLPLMTARGHYIINGSHRVVLSQFSRIGGLYFQTNQKEINRRPKALLAPKRGPWTRFYIKETKKFGIESWVRIKPDKRIPARLFLQTFGYLETLRNIKNPEWKRGEYLKLERYFKQYNYSLKDPRNKNSLKEILPVVQRLFNKYFYLGPFARKQLNRRIGIKEQKPCLTYRDISYIIDQISNLIEQGSTIFLDDIDHLINKRLKTSGELLQAELEQAFLSLKKHLEGKKKPSNLSKTQFLDPSKKTKEKFSFGKRKLEKNIKLKEKEISINKSLENKSNYREIEIKNKNKVYFKNYKNLSFIKNNYQKTNFSNFSLFCFEKRIGHNSYSLYEKDIVSTVKTSRKNILKPRISTFDYQKSLLKNFNLINLNEKTLKTYTFNNSKSGLFFSRKKNIKNILLDFIFLNEKNLTLKNNNINSKITYENLKENNSLCIKLSLLKFSFLVNKFPFNDLLKKENKKENNVKFPEKQHLNILFSNNLPVSFQKVHFWNYFKVFFKNKKKIFYKKKENNFNLSLSFSKDKSPFKLKKKPKKFKHKPSDFISIRIFTKTLRTFFGTNPLSQYMDQTNPLAELTHKRRLSYLGPGGVDRAGAGIAIRGIHPSHYGRICPIETPEGKNAGLVNSLSLWGRLTKEGTFKTPYIKVTNGSIMPNGNSFTPQWHYISTKQEIEGFKLHLNFGHKKPKLFPISFDKKQLEGENKNKPLFKRNTMYAHMANSISFKMFAGDLKIPESFFLPNKSLPIRDGTQGTFHPSNRNYADFFGVDSVQNISIATSLIPFLEHNDATRALMGSNMQRQALPLLRPEVPLVRTGLEGKVVGESGQAVQAEFSGIVSLSTGSHMSIDFFKFIEKPKNSLKRNIKLNFFIKNFNIASKKDKNISKYSSNLTEKTPDYKIHRYRRFQLLQDYIRSNQATVAIQRPALNEGQWAQKGDLLADCAASKNGILSVGKNIIVAYLPMDGFNFEDAIVVSDRLVQEEVYKSVHVQRVEFDMEAYFVRRLPEKKSETSKSNRKKNIDIISLDNPHLTVLEKKNLNSLGIIKIGSWVGTGDVLVSRLLPINRKLHPAKYLLLSVLQEKDQKRNIIDTMDISLRVPKHVHGRVINVKIIGNNISLLKKERKEIIENLSLQEKKLKIVHDNKSLHKKKRSPGIPNLILLKTNKKQSKQKKIKNLKTNNISTFLSFKEKNNNKINYHHLIGNFLQNRDIRKNSLYLKSINSKIKNLKKNKFSYDFWDHLPTPQPTIASRFRLLKLNWHFSLEKSTVSNKNNKNIPGKQNINLLPKSFFNFDRRKISKNLKTSIFPNKTINENLEKTIKQLKNVKSNLSLTKTSFLKNNPSIETSKTDSSTKLFKDQRNILSISMKKSFQKLRYPKNFAGEGVYNELFGNKGTNLPNAAMAKKQILTKEQFQPLNHKYWAQLWVQKRTLFLFNERKDFSNLSNLAKKQLWLFGATKPRIDMSSKDDLLTAENIVKFQKDKQKTIIKFYDKRRLLRTLTNKLSEKEFKLLYNASQLKIKKQLYQKYLREPYKILQIRIYIAECKNLQVGDKMSGRHGNKGIISTILPREDMPYLPDGTAVDMVLNPLGIPSRMNVGQVFECLLGLAASICGEMITHTPFDEIYGPEASRSLVYLFLYIAKLRSKIEWVFHPGFPGKTVLFDGRTGLPYEQWITVGRAYMLKLIHVVDEKIHVRSVGPRALITQQPVKGRKRGGGQRLGEMELWALEGFGAAYTLQEILTVKSDDVSGRKRLDYFVISTGVVFNHVPDAYRLMMCELRCLCFNVELTAN